MRYYWYDTVNCTPLGLGKVSATHHRVQNLLLSHQIYIYIYVLCCLIGCFISRFLWSRRSWRIPKSNLTAPHVANPSSHWRALERRSCSDSCGAATKLKSAPDALSGPSGHLLSNAPIDSRRQRGMREVREAWRCAPWHFQVVPRHPPCRNCHQPSRYHSPCLPRHLLKAAAMVWSWQKNQDNLPVPDHTWPAYRKPGAVWSSRLEDVQPLHIADQSNHKARFIVSICPASCWVPYSGPGIWDHLGCLDPG